MFCRNCGIQLGEQAVVCVGCGVGAGTGNRFCYNCGGTVDPVAAVCLKCGVALVRANPAGWGPGAPKSKMVAGLLGIFLGAFGIHRFYLGYTVIGVIQVLVTVVIGLITCGIGVLAGSIWGFIEGILILTGQIDKDAQGRPLID